MSDFVKDHIIIAPAVIPPRKPRPLTASERRKLRKAAGGDATPEQLRALSAAFAKPEASNVDGIEVRARSNNGWTA